MTASVIHLPRPREARSAQPALGFYVRVGRNDHKELLELLSAGEKGIFGLVIEAPYAERHKELITEAKKRELDVILDPKTQQMSLPGSYNDVLAALPWGQSKQHHTVGDFDGQDGQARIAKIIEFALAHDCTQILGPTHLIGDPNDPWLQRDLVGMKRAADYIEKKGADLGLIYSLGLPISLLRDDTRRGAVVAALQNAPRDAMWLKVENFGDDATGDKTAAYINACRDFHVLNVPIVADYVGGLPALGALALAAVGGLSHGVTMNQRFTAASWRRPTQKGGGGAERRVYFPQLDMLVKPDMASEFIGSSLRVRTRHVCRDPHCCPRGLTDMMDRPARHALYQRAREIEKLNELPESVRLESYLEHVRRVSDDVALVAGFDKVPHEFREKLRAKQKALGHFRDAMAHLGKSASKQSAALKPTRHRTSERSGPF